MILRRLQDLRSLLAVLVVERLHILNAEPYPRPGLALPALRQVDARPVPGHAGEVVANVTLSVCPPNGAASAAAGSSSRRLAVGCKRC